MKSPAFSFVFAKTLRIRTAKGEDSDFGGTGEGAEARKGCRWPRPCFWELCKRVGLGRLDETHNCCRHACREHCTDPSRNRETCRNRGPSTASAGRPLPPLIGSMLKRLMRTKSPVAVYSLGDRPLAGMALSSSESKVVPNGGRRRERRRGRRSLR